MRWKAGEWHIFPEFWRYWIGANGDFDGGNARVPHGAFFGGDIRAAAYRIAKKETQKLRYFASA